MVSERVQYWLAEVNKYDVAKLMDGPHQDETGPETALELIKRLPMLGECGRKFAIAKVILSDPTGKHGPINKKAIETLSSL